MDLFEILFAFYSKTTPNLIDLDLNYDHLISHLLLFPLLFHSFSISLPLVFIYLYLVVLWFSSLQIFCHNLIMVVILLKLWLSLPLNRKMYLKNHPNPSISLYFIRYHSPHQYIYLVVVWSELAQNYHLYNSNLY